MSFGGQTGPTEDSDPIRSEVARIINLKMQRNGSYRNSPMNTLPDRYWLAQIVIKAVRAEEKVDAAERIDELEDVIVYALNEILKTKGLTI